MSIKNELMLLQELQDSEELSAPFYWIEESNGYGKLTRPAEKIALKLIEPKEKENPLFKKEDVEGLFQGWGLIVF